MIFKTERARRRFFMIDPMLLLIVSDINYYCVRNKVPFIITSTIRTPDEDKAIGAVSKTHQEGRAVDISTRKMSRDFIEDLIKHFSDKYKGWGAISSRDLKERLIVYHDGTAPHLHVQVAPNEKTFSLIQGKLEKDLELQLELEHLAGLK